MRVTGSLLKVLHVLLSASQAEIYGLEVIRGSGLQSGTVYPLLDRMEAAGWLTSRWEDAAQSHSGGPRRRFYSLTAYGAHEACELFKEYRLGGVAWT